MIIQTHEEEEEGDSTAVECMFSMKRRRRWMRRKMMMMMSRRTFNFRRDVALNNLRAWSTLTSTAASASITSRPRITRPTTCCWPSRCKVGPAVMVNSLLSADSETTPSH
jgi:hypothetical protein